MWGTWSHVCLLGILQPACLLSVQAVTTCCHVSCMRIQSGTVSRLETICKG